MAKVSSQAGKRITAGIDLGSKHGVERWVDEQGAEVAWRLRAMSNEVIVADAKRLKPLGKRAKAGKSGHLAGWGGGGSLFHCAARDQAPARS